MGEDVDIVLTTRNRLDYLQQSLERIFEHTTTPYCLHIVDDASNEGNAKYLIQLWQAGKVHDLLLRGQRSGIMANSNVGTWLAFSDPTVFVDDDVLCPGGIEPDWLSRGIQAMQERPELALLALNHPGARRNSYEQDNEVTYCKYVGGTFMFARRKFLSQHSLNHSPDNFAHATTQFRSQGARRMGWKVGYLTETFCYHIGRKSANGSKYKGHFAEPENWLTLRPSDKWIWKQPDS